MLKVINLKTEYEVDPIGTDVRKPRFFWQLDSDRQGCRQEAYEITVGAWRSGRVESDNTIGIYYEGEELKPETRYDILLTVWDNHGEKAETTGFFETGLGVSGTELENWSGAKFIGGGDEDLIYYPHYLSVYRGSYELRIEHDSTKAGFVLGANDARLMDINRNTFGVQNGKDESYIYIETDISGLKVGEKAYLRIYRVGYTKDDSEYKPIRSFALDGVNSENAHDYHKVAFAAVHGTFDIYFDGETDEFRLNNPDPNDKRPFFMQSYGVNLNPAGQGGDYIAYGLVCDTGFKVPAGNEATFRNVMIKNYREPFNKLYCAEDEVKIVGSCNGSFVVKDDSRGAVPLLRKSFDVRGKVAKARLYITARGIYEAKINGKRVGEDWLNPGLTQYNKTHMYQTYDVTELVSEEKNVIEAQVAEGWWSGAITFTGHYWNYFGDRNSLLAKLVITYEDGTTDVVKTDESWEISTDGPVKYASLFQGQVTDLNDEYTDFKPAKIVPLDSHTAYVGKRPTFGPFGQGVDDMGYEEFKLMGQVGPCVGISGVFTAQSVEEVRKGVFLYDMGQNIAGIPSVFIDGCKGQTVKLRFGEITYPDLPEYKGLEGTLMLENIRAAYAQDIFVLADGRQVLEPHFTFHGYQYVEITGIDKALPLEDVRGVALSSVPVLSAGYETSNDEINKLWSNISWSLRDNYISIPTDCPQRNERMGWSGDLSVFSRTAVHMADSSSFLRRHMMALRDTQSPEGRFADIAPIGGGFGGVLWGSVGLTAAWESYLQYKDTDMLREHYDAMRRYIDYLDTRIDPKTGLLDEGPLGDWLGPEYCINESALLWNAYHAYDIRILSETAKALGLSTDAEHYYNKYVDRKAFFNRTYVDKETHRTVFSSEEAMNGSRFAMMMAPTKLPFPKQLPNDKYLMDTQTSYAVPLALGLFDDEYVADAGRFLAEAVKRENHDNDNTPTPPFSLMTGFIGTAWIGEALSMAGEDATVYRLVQNGEYPSWIYSVRQGATTIWERVNSFTKDKGFGGNNNMNSFNHYSYGAVASWMMRYSLGIKRLDDAPGFSEFILCPTPDPTGQMKYAKGFVDTVSGRIESSWEVTSEGTTYRFKIPANTSATLFLKEDNSAQHLVSGEYVFRMTK